MKTYYTYQRISAPAPTAEALKAFTRKVNEKLEDQAIKTYGNIEYKDLHEDVRKVFESKVDGTTFQSYVTQTAEEIVLFATKTELNGAVGELEGDIETLTGITTTHTTQISENATAITFKASQSSVDALGGTVSSLSTQMSLVPGQISLAVTNGMTHVSETPPTGAGLYAGRIWHIPSTDEQFRWKAIVSETARSYSASLSGVSVSFNDLSHELALDVTVKTIAAQAGTGTPSPTNIRAISGKATAKAVLGGRNVLKPGTTTTNSGVTATVAADGTVTLNGTCTGAAGTPSLFVVPLGFFLNGQFTFSANNTLAYGSDLQLRLMQDVSSQVASPITNFSINTVGAKNTFTLSNQWVYGWAIRVGGGITYTNVVIKPQLESGPDATGYVPYDGKEYTLAPDAALYGLTGYEDEIGNDGHVVHATKMLMLNGSESWGPSSVSTNTVRVDLNTAFSDGRVVSANKIMCSHFNPAYGDTSDTEHCRNGAAANYATLVVYINKTRLTGWSDAWSDAQRVTAFKAWLAANPMQVLYQLATPATATVAPVQINGVSDGYNVVIGDGSSVAVSYVGSGWSLISGTARRLYAGANYKFDEYGMEITQKSLNGEPVQTKFIASAEKNGFYRVSDGKMVGGTVVFTDHTGAQQVALLSSLLATAWDFEADGNVDNYAVPETRFYAPTLYDSGSTAIIRGTQFPFGLSFYNKNPDTQAISFSGFVGGGYGLIDQNLTITSDTPYLLLTSSRAENLLTNSLAYLALYQMIIAFRGDLLPVKDNTYDCGSTTRRIKKYYGASSTISTSDEREKHDIKPVDPEMMRKFILELDVDWFRLNGLPDEAMIGFIAQKFRDAMRKAGMPDDYGGFLDELPDHSRLAIRYEQVIGPVVSVTKDILQRLDKIEQFMKEYKNGEA